eukprot:1099532-Pyramimonas_sp.AAC.1
MDEDGLLSGYCEAFGQWFSEVGWSGTHGDFLNGNADFHAACDDGEATGEWVLASSRGGEVSLKDLDPGELGQFQAADAAEWRSVARP